jgi:hypothetical protein
LLASQKAERLPAEVYIYAYDAQKQLRDFIAQRFDLDISSVAEKLVRGGLKFCGELALPPGSYRLRVLVRNGETGKMGLAVSNLEVPGFSERAYLATPIFLETSDRSVLIRGKQHSPGGKQEFPEYPVVESEAETLVPAPLPDVQPGKTSVVSVVAYHFGDPDSPSLKVGGSVLAADGRPVAEAALAVRAHVAALDHGKQTLLLDFTPEFLSPGRYMLRVFLQDGASGASAHAAAPFLVP